MPCSKAGDELLHHNACSSQDIGWRAKWKSVLETKDWFIGLRENLNRKPLIAPLKKGLSCKFSLKPIHWWNLWNSSVWCIGVVPGGMQFPDLNRDSCIFSYSFRGQPGEHDKLRGWWRTSLLHQTYCWLCCGCHWHGCCYGSGRRALLHPEMFGCSRLLCHVIVD